VAFEKKRPFFSPKKATSKCLGHFTHKLQITKKRLAKLNFWALIAMEKISINSETVQSCMEYKIWGICHILPFFFYFYGFEKSSSRWQVDEIFLNFIQG